MSDAKRKEDWSKPSAMAIPKGGYIGEPERGRYGAIFPKTPACHGFTIIAKIIPGREDTSPRRRAATSGRDNRSDRP